MRRSDTEDRSRQSEGPAPRPRRWLFTLATTLLALWPIRQDGAEPGAGSGRDRATPERRTLAEVIEFALLTNPQIQFRRARVLRLEGNAAAAGIAASPEIRFGSGRSRGAGTGRSFQSESGSALQSGRSGMQTTRRNPDGTGTASTRLESSQSRSSYTETAWSDERVRETGDGFNLGLRFAPSNPWLAAAERGTARAETRGARAELQEKELQLACEIAEIALRMAYRERMLRVARLLAARCGSTRDRLRRSYEAGDLPRSEYTDASLRFSSARADLDRLATQQADLDAQFRLLAGVTPAELDLTALRAGALCGMRLPTNEMEQTELFIALASRRPDILMSEATAAQCANEWREARSRRIPWLSHMQVAYAWWDDREVTDQVYGSSRSGSGTSSSASTESEIPTSEIEERQTTASEWESRESRGAERVTEDRSGHEWRFEVGVELPLFEWLSPESKRRRQAGDEMRRALGPLRCRALNELRMAADSAVAARTRLEAMRAFVAAEICSLRALADQAAAEGVKGEIEALSVEERIAELALRLFDVAERCALAEVQFYRAGGLLPGQAATP